MSERSWGGWPFWPPKPRRSTLREHRLAESPDRATCAAWRRRTFPEAAGWSQVVDLAVVLLLFATAIVLVSVLVESTAGPPPAAGEPTRTRDPDDLLNLVDRPEWVPVNRQPRDDAPEPPLEPEGGMDAR